MRRKILIKQFRNIGLKETQEIILNNDYSRGKSGNLIILIGSNNSGKTNVLEAILKLRLCDKINERDLTTLSYDDKYRKPCVSLFYQDDNYELEYVKEYNSNGYWKIIKSDFNINIPTREQIKIDIEKIKNEASKRGLSLKFLDDFIKNIKDELVRDEDIIDMIPSVCKNIQQNFNHHTIIYNSIRTLPTMLYNTDIYDKNVNLINNKVNEITNLPTLPNIHFYEEVKLKGNDLILSDIKNIKNSRFFTSLFNILKINSDEIENAYKHYNSFPNSAIFNKLEKIYNPKLEVLSDQFNKMYKTTNDKYKFTLDFEANNISFGIARGINEDDITLEFQSSGFRWFFDLFFNFLSLNTIKAGDIIIMDEPAANLHPEGQKELRKFIKEFAIRNDILFIIATQSPFLIDPDYYEELRVISMENNMSKIINNFTAVNLDDPDSLVPIKNALTIKQNVLYDINTDVYWVEGITDYIYLTFFKKELGIKDIAFIPFNGVGNNSEQTKKVLSKIIKVRFCKRGLLVDGDKAGKDMYEQSKNTDLINRTHIISELEIGGKHPMIIEDLFSENDKKKYPFIKEKRTPLVFEIKNHMSIHDFSKETVDNFTKLFQILLDD